MKLVDVASMLRRDADSARREARRLDRVLSRLARLVQPGDEPTQLERELIDERLDHAGSVREGGWRTLR